jgi:hypothetical protein
MRYITIREPIWKYLAIGIRKDKVTDDFQIKISYKTKNRKLLYPGTFFMKKEEILNNRLDYLGNMWVYIIPIANLKEK